MRLPCCLCVSPSPSTFERLNQSYVMAPEPISAPYIRKPSHQSVCLYVYPRKLLQGNEHIPNNRGIVGRVDFYAVRVVSSEVGD
jgi:hypothetical protein